MSQERDSYFDNAKFFLMVLVVFGHLLQPFIESNEVYSDLYYTIFTFHMPAFILIAGFFSKHYRRPGYIGNCFKAFLLPYVCLQVVYTIFYYLTGETQSLHFDFSVPQWSLWFLLAMLFWNLLLWLFAPLKRWLGVSVSILMALLAGYLPFIGRELTLQRTLVFFPFFLLGFHLPPLVFQRLRASRWRFLGALGVLGSYLFIQINERLNKYWLFGSKPYDDFLAVPELGAVVRGIVFLLGLLGIFSFLCLVPKRKLFITACGKHTMTVYLLHGFIVKTLRLLPVKSLGWLGFLGLLVGSFGLTLLLGNESLNRWLNQGLAWPVKLLKNLQNSDSFR